MAVFGRGDSQPREFVDPPRPVSIRVDKVFHRTPHPHYRHLSIRTRLTGLQIEGRVSGHLHAWIRTTEGDWLALCEFPLSTGAGDDRLVVRQWCPSGAVSPRVGDGD